MLRLVADSIVGPATAQWVLIAFALVLAGAGISSLVGGRPAVRLPAVALFIVNPFVYERLWAGQVAPLFAYALLPFVVRSCLDEQRSRRFAGVRTGLWLTVMTALSPAFVWLGVIAIVVTVCAQRFAPRALRWAGAAGGFLVIGSAYVLVPALAGVTQPAGGAADLASYRTRGSGPLAPFDRILAMTGFWRPEPSLPMDTVSGWPFLYAALLLVVVRGVVRLTGERASRRPAWTLVAVAVVAVVVAAGDRGPTGPLFAQAFRTVPGLVVLREPQKAVALLVVAYSFFFGHGAAAVAAASSRTRSRLAVTIALIALPVLVTPTLLWGAGGLRPSRYPTAWHAADEAMGDGGGRVLFLPWHQYLSFPFTGDRRISNPAPSFFRRDVIAGDNVELGRVESTSSSPRSAYLEALYDAGDELCSFGDLVSPLGVEYVVLAKTVDWQRYGWLTQQSDLAVELDTPELTLYRNRAYRGLGWSSPQVEAASSLDELNAVSAREGIAGRAFSLARLEPLPARRAACRPPAEERAEEVSQEGLGRYRAAPGRPGRIVLVSEPFRNGWTVAGHAPRPLAGGVLGGVARGAGAVAITFEQRSVVALGASVTLLVLLFGGLALVVDRRRREQP